MGILNARVVERDEWLAMRRQGIFSTDVAKILRLCPPAWGGPLDVALDKRGLLPERTSKEMDAGLRLEPYVAAIYAAETKQELAKPLPRFHHSVAWMGATGDYVGDNGVNVSIKTTNRGEGWGEPWTDQIPEQYLTQSQWEMSVFGLEETHVAVLGPTPSEFRIFRVPISYTLIDKLVQICGDFWHRLQSGWTPEIDWSDPRTPDLISLLYRPDETVTCELDAEALQWVQERERLGREISDATDARDFLKAKLIQRMQTASVGYLPDGRELRRTTINKADHMVRAHDETTMRVCKARKARKA